MVCAVLWTSLEMLHRLEALAGRRTVIKALAVLVAGAVGAQAVSLALRATPDRTQPTWQEQLANLSPIDNGERFFQPLADGGRVELTLSPTLQRAADRLLVEYARPYAGAVLLSVDDGRVLALSGRSTVEPDKSAAELTLRPWAPAASVFKLVTASALVESGVPAQAKVCYHGGTGSVEADNLVDHPRLDRTCRTLAYGLARSQNAILGRLAYDYLDSPTLQKVARAFDFGVPLELGVPVAPSEAELPADGLPFARVAAGFWQTSLSPLHGAYLAATLARGGETPPLRLVDRVVDGAGNSLRPLDAPSHRAVSVETARTVANMMVGTTEFGSARIAFHDRRHGNRRALRGVAVAGKTGTLSRAEPYLGYSWFVGFAPAAHPEVAVAVLLGNGPDDHLRASEVARDLLAVYFTEHPVQSRHLAAR